MNRVRRTSNVLFDPIADEEEEEEESITRDADHDTWTVSKLNENPHQTLFFLLRFYIHDSSARGCKMGVSGRTGW